MTHVSTRLAATVLAVMCGNLAVCQQHGGSPSVGGTPAPILLPSQVVGFIGDSRSNNIREWFDILAGEGFTCAAIPGSLAVYKLPVQFLPALPRLQAFWDFTDTNHMWQQPWTGGAHPISNGDPVGLVQDISGSGRDLVLRGNLAEKLSVDSINQLPTVAGDGDMTEGFNISGAPLDISADLTVAAVVRSNGDNMGLLSSQNPPQEIGFIGGRLSIFDGQSKAADQTSTTTGDAFHLLVWQRAGGIDRFFKDGVQLGQDEPAFSHGNFSFTQCDNWLDEAAAVSATDKAAMVVYDRALSSQELEELVVYVNSRFQMYTSDAVNKSTKPSTGTSDWLPTATSWITEGATFEGDVSQNPFNTTLTEFKDSGVQIVYLDLGVNDYIRDVPVTTYSSNLSTIIDTLVANGFKVIVDIPYRTKYLPTSFTDPYRDAIEAIGAARDPSKVVITTTMDYDWGNANIGNSAYSDDGVHMNSVGIPLEEIRKQYEIARGLRLLVPTVSAHRP